MPRKSRNSSEAAFGEVLRAGRIAAGLSQESLAFESGCHPTYISLLERGKKSPSLRMILALCRALGVRPSTLVERVEQRLKT